MNPSDIGRKSVVHEIITGFVAIIGDERERMINKIELLYFRLLRN
jgi:hypothetical protein